MIPLTPIVLLRRHPTDQMKRCLPILSLLCAFHLGAAEGGPERAVRSTLYIIGDSTVKNGTRGQRGWGEVITPYFDTNKIRIENHAIGGRSSRTFFTEGRWDRVLTNLQPGDFVLIQFGHNDGGAVNDTSRARGSIKGTGEQTQEIDNLLTKKHEVVHTFGWYLRKYVSDAKAKGATPIVCSLVPRKIWKDGKITRGDNYAKCAEEVARAENVAFVDLREIIARRYDALGTNKVNELFGDDHTHTNAEGAVLNAECVVAGLKALKPCVLCERFSEKAAPIEKFTTEQVSK
jgi:rhamnogalacturonan acetylesterase